MFEIKKFDIGSVAIISAIFFLIMGIFIALPFGAIGFIINLIGHSTGLNDFPTSFGFVFVFTIPVFYAIVGTLMNVIMALIYNLIAQKLGGLKMELVKIEPIVNKIAETKAD